MSSVASAAQAQTRGKRGAARDVEELEALEKAQETQRGRFLRAARAEWDEFVTANAHKDESGSLIWDVRLMRALADDALATLRYLARGGDRVSAIWLAENFLGAPDLPYEEKIKRMNEHEALGKIEEILGLHFTTDHDIDTVLAAFSSPPPPSLPGE